MTRDDIIRMAREAGFEPDMFGIGIWDRPEFERFAALVAAHEREACAQMLDEASGTGRIISCTHAAAAIRARGQA